MITQEIMDVMDLAIRKHHPSLNGKRSFAGEIVREVYPLIRQQALEECAAVCDGLEGMFTQKLENSVIQTWCSPKDCAHAIRNLKDKADEAHNG